jgi:hypothetical protein
LNLGAAATAAAASVVRFRRSRRVIFFDFIVDLRRPQLVHLQETGSKLRFC